jgi:hypothetical protein
VTTAPPVAALQAQSRSCTTSLATSSRYGNEGRLRLRLAARRLLLPLMVCVGLFTLAFHRPCPASILLPCPAISQLAVLLCLLPPPYRSA